MKALVPCSFKRILAGFSELVQTVFRVAPPIFLVFFSSPLGPRAK